MEFEYNQSFNDLYLPWAGHRYFGMQLIECMEPTTIVELGTWRGTSMFSMLQGVKNKDLNTAFYAIDSWEGDYHAGFYEGEQYLKEIKDILNKYYPKCNVFLCRTRFEEAVNQFANESIDILHIDGLHTYDAVKNDYHTWFPKMKTDGVILFHDIVVRERDFGVWQFWEELKNQDETLCFEFEHSNGLGILTFDKSKAKKISDLIAKNMVSNLQNLYEELKSSQRHLNSELQSIYNSKYWKLKERIKKIISL